LFDLPRIDECVVVFLYLERLAARGGIEYLSAAASNKKPPAKASREAIFILISGKLPPGGIILVNGRPRR
jgi:hypothetical protein